MSDVASLFLKLTSGPPGASEKRILGEATDAEYKHQIVVEGWGWDLTRSSESNELTKIGSRIPPPPNSVVPAVLRFDKTMCRATSGMLAAMRTGELLNAVFSLEEDSDPDFLLQLTLGRVRILKYDLNIDGPDVKETWQFDYDTIRFDYSPNYKEGKLTVNLTRHAGASTQPAADNSGEAKIRALAEDMEPAALKPVIKSLEELSRAGPRSAKPVKPGGVVKK